MGEKVRFVSSKSPNLRVILTKSIKREVNGEVFIEYGKSAQFKNRYFTTEDPEIIELMKKSKFFNVKEGYYLDSGKTSEEILKDQKDLMEATKKQFFCNICKKGFMNSNGLMSHIKSKDHKEKEKLATAVS